MLKARPINGNNPLTLMIANHFLYYPTPKSLNYNWSFGSLAGLFFALQIVTGIFLAMHYTPHVEWAFASVEHIMTDVTGGYLFRYFHANGASMIFILIYLHIGRNLYYQSYITRPVLWNTGVVIFLLMMATAFIGYVLPWGQMSFWGATVITSLVTAVPFVGEAIAHWVWGGFSISNATLVRFYALHFTLPFIVLGIIMGHLVALHTAGSSDPLTLAFTPGKVTFHPYFTLKDTFIFFVVFAFFANLVCFAPNLLGHSDNFIPANPLVTPAHIVPEWYFTPFYAILRACPNKLGGAIGMFAAILLLLAVPMIAMITSPDAMILSTVHSTPHRVSCWFFGATFMTLMYLGMRAAEAPYVLASKFFTFLYFAYFVIVLPFLTLLSRQLLNTNAAPATGSNNPSQARPILPLLPIQPVKAEIMTAVFVLTCAGLIIGGFLQRNDGPHAPDLDGHAYRDKAWTERVEREERQENEAYQAADRAWEQYKDENKNAAAKKLSFMLTNYVNPSPAADIQKKRDDLAVMCGNRELAEHFQQLRAVQANTYAGYETPYNLTQLEWSRARLYKQAAKEFTGNSPVERTVRETFEWRAPHHQKRAEELSGGWLPVSDPKAKWGGQATLQEVLKLRTENEMAHGEDMRGVRKAIERVDHGRAYWRNRPSPDVSGDPVIDLNREPQYHEAKTLIDKANKARNERDQRIKVLEQEADEGAQACSYKYSRWADSSATFDSPDHEQIKALIDGLSSSLQHLFASLVYGWPTLLQLLYMGLRILHDAGYFDRPIHHLKNFYFKFIWRCDLYRRRGQ